MAADVELVKANLLRCGVEINHVEMMLPHCTDKADWAMAGFRRNPINLIGCFEIWARTREGSNFWMEARKEYEGREW